MVHGSHFTDLLSSSNNSICLRQQHLQGQGQHVIEGELWSNGEFDLCDLLLQNKTDFFYSGSIRWNDVRF